MEYNRFTIGNFTIQQHVTTGNVIFYFIELLLCAIACPLNIIFVCLMYNTSTIHKNLRIVLISSSIANSLYCMSRYMIVVPLIVAYFFNVDISTISYCWAAKSFHHIVVSAPGLTFFIVIFERSIASKLYQTYEFKSCYQSGYILTIFQWLYGFFVVIINQVDVYGTPRPYSRLPCQIEYTTGRCLVAIVAFLGVLNLVSAFAFISIRKFNRTLFKQRTWRLHKLSELYQVSENLRSIKLLLPVLFVMMISNIIGIFLISLNAWIYLAVREIPESQRATIMTSIVGRGSEITQFYDICSVAGKIAFCYVIKSHPMLYRKWNTMIYRTKIGSSEPKTLDGSNMTFTTVEETRHHFDSLHEMWK